MHSSIQNFKKSLVYIQSKAPSSVCGRVRNDNYNPFHINEKIIDLLCKARCYQFGCKEGCVSSSSDFASIQFIKEVSCRLNCFIES